MNVQNINMYPTEDIIALAYAAYRINGGYEKSTRRYSEGQPTTWSNKELITFTAKSDWVAEDFVPITVTNEDREAAKQGEKHMRRYSLLALGDLPQFELDLFSAYSAEQTNISRVGLIAYLPAFIDRELAEKELKLRYKTEFADSVNIGTPGERIAGDVEIFKLIPIADSFNGGTAYLHFGAVGKDLVCFTKSEMYAAGQTFVITAKVKGYDLERNTNLPMTRLNYVKLKKVNTV